ncbi:hypothetical protein [Acinetobacter sp. ANC 3791]|uniref:hypothetical protein n=1 Tax=Acinetobacter sp. ANC 3791 TaxID=2529836 RepID=UPI001040A450|nr:hypothetical protein [Acinetobacter sp. ANC 3791]TCB80896.1 hypothetical protein E0H90_15380 [Acinetobacter sp. ANC 3791]
MNEFIFSDDELIGLLKPYQQKILLPLIASVGEEEAAKIWLSPESTNQFVRFGGGENQPDPYFDRLVKEIRKLICGDESYQEYREKIIEKANASAFVVVASISGLMGDIFGIAPAILTPVVILILKMISKVGINAWCAI